MSDKEKTLEQWLSSIPIKNIVPNREVISFTEDDIVEDVLKTLSYNEILSAPVCKSNLKEFIGFVDVLDIIAFLFSLAETGKHHFPNETIIDSLFKFASIKKVMDASRRDPFCPVFEGANVLQLMEVFGRGIHRVPLYRSNEHDIVNLISQRDVFNYLYEHRERLGSFLDKTLDDVCFEDTELNFGREPLISVSCDGTIADALGKMYREKVSAVAVVDEKEEIVAHLSASDFRTLKNVSDLKLSVLDFLDKYRFGLNTVVVEPTERMSGIFDKVYRQRLHRVWVMEENNQKPIGVFSLTDLIQAVEFEASKEEN